ncbi:MAG: DUF4468 domain-containing protein [Flavobacteriales bacterium]|nr:DUF4468 domain-containing protein [Flavobacteriales bacterium]
MTTLTPSILRALMRLSLVILTLLLPWHLGMTASGQAPAAVLTYARSVSVPLNALQLFDAATDAWTWTFGKEPGARVLSTDRSAGVLKGTARLNFRSRMLTGREETMGTVSYQVLVQVQAGECRITISELTHTGNRNTTRAGSTLKQLMRADADARKTEGLSRANVERLHGELRAAANEHLTGLLQAFEARLRASVER